MPAFVTWITLDWSARRTRHLIGMNGHRGRSVTLLVVVAHANANANALPCTTKPQHQSPDVRGMRVLSKRVNHNRAHLSGLFGVIALRRVRKIHQVWFGENVVGNAPVCPFPQLTVSTRKIANLAAQRVQSPVTRIALGTASVNLPQKTASIHMCVVWSVCSML